MNIKSEVLAALNRTIPDVPPTFEELATTIAALSPRPLATKSELAELRTLQADFEHAGRTRDAHTFVTAKDAYIAHQGEIQKTIRRGESLSATDSWTLDDWKQDFEGKCNTAKNVCNAIAAETRIVAQKVASRFAEHAQDLAREIDEADGQRYAAFGLASKPHALADKLRETAGLALRRASGNQGPKQQVPYIQL